jgi:hypothetical protein
MRLKFIPILLICLMLVVAVFAAVPEGPSTIDRNASSARTAAANLTMDALAGNVSQLTITGKAATQSWQGYYGNVSGTVSLETASGSVMYDWAQTNPQGEIYAVLTKDIPLWGTPSQTGGITCWNYTQGTSNGSIYYGEIEGWDPTEEDGEITRNALTAGQGFNIKKNAVDSINNTFRRTSTFQFPTFYVGNQIINGTNNKMYCPSLALYNSSGGSTYAAGEPGTTGAQPGGNFQEVILVDTTNEFILFTAIIDWERDLPGFDGNYWDFQMIVPEDGHGTNTAVTTYYFYVELE